MWEVNQFIKAHFGFPSGTNPCVSTLLVLYLSECVAGL
jgi:hypothetical protein